MPKTNRLQIGSFLVLATTLLFNSCNRQERIIFLGDSITQEGNQPGGYIDVIRNASLATGEKNAPEIFGAGISGNKVPDLQARLDKDVLSHNPTIVVIYIGINDVWHFTMPVGGTKKDRYEAGLKDIIGRVTASGARVILCTPSVVGEKNDRTNPLDPMLDEYSDISRSVANSLSVPVCDLRKAFQEKLLIANPENKEKGILTRDGVHLNEDGNKFVAERISESLRAIME